MRDASGNKLRPSRRSRSFAAGILNVSRDHIARHQILLEVAKKVGETVNFVMPEDDGMSYKDRVETDWPFRVQLPVGSNVPFHCTASGKCFLASLKGKERANMVNALLLDPVTANTICDPDILLKELKTISKQGYATDNEKFMEGMVAVAVPVSGPNRKFLAALAFHAPAMRLDITEAISKKDILVQGAEKLSRLFFEHAGNVNPSSSSMEHNE